MPHLFVQPREVPLSLLGFIVPNAVAYFYGAGTSTPRQTFTDATLTVNHPFPVPANNVGVLPPIWIDPADGPYKVDIRTFVLANPLSVSLPRYPVDGIEVAPSTIIYDVIGAEDDLGIIPVALNYYYGHAKRYGAKGDRATDDTVAIQNAIYVAFAIGGEVYIPEDFWAKVTNLAIPTPTNLYGQAITIRGVNPTSSILETTASSGDIINLSGATPAADPTGMNFRIENITLRGDSESNRPVNGIALRGVSGWQIKNVQIYFCAKAVDIESGLLGTISDSCNFSLCAYGVYSRRIGGAGSGANLVTVTDIRINNNNVAIDIGSGDSWKFLNCQIEANGVLGDPNTGAGFFRPTLDDEFGLSQISFDNVRAEQNKGRGFLFENIPGLSLSIANSTAVGNENKDFEFQGAAMVEMDNVMAESVGGGITSVTAAVAHFSVKNSKFTTLNDSAPYPIYENVTTAAGHIYVGRPGSFNIVMTGMASGGTGTVLTNRHGDDVTWEVRGDIFGTSNTTFCALGTGQVPPEICPASGTRTFGMWTLDDNIGYYSRITVNANGSATFRKGDLPNGFTASGNKGIGSGIGRYRLV